MNWRVADSLITLRDQINEMYPDRSRVSDGTIGDASHSAQGSASDHNPWITDRDGVGVVTALDITHDKEHGPDIKELGQVLADSRDGRIKYLIQNYQILAPLDGWYWQPYSGTADPHTNHIHISVNTYNYDDSQQWNLGKDENMIQDADDAAEVIRAVFKREPTENEIKDLIGREWKQALVIYRTSEAGQSVAAMVDQYPSLEKQVKGLQNVSGKTVGIDITTAMDKAAKYDQIKQALS